MVDVCDLRRTFDDVEALRGVTFAVGAGESFGFLGPNGAGKSTTISILCTLLTPSGGTARVAGFDVARQALAIRRNIGLVFQGPTLDDDLTVAENLRFHAQIYGMSRGEIAPRVAEVLDVVDLADRRDRMVRTLSGGMKRRLEIVRGLLHRPRVLFLDEPTIGLDPQSRSDLWRYIDDLREREGVTTFLTTHYMDEAERCDRIAIIDEGRLVAEGSPDALRLSVGADRIDIQVDDPQAAIARVRERFGIEAQSRAGAVTFRVAAGEEFAPMLIAELGLPIRSLRIARPTLDDVFMTYAGRALGDAEGVGDVA